CCGGERDHIGRQCLALAHGLQIAYPDTRCGGGIEYELLTMHHASHIIHAAVAGIAAFAESAKRTQSQNCCNTDGGGSAERADRCHEGGRRPGCCRCGGCCYLRRGGCSGRCNCCRSGRPNSSHLGCCCCSGDGATQCQNRLIRQLLRDHLPDSVDHGANHALGHALHCIAHGFGIEDHIFEGVSELLCEAVND